MDLKQKIKNSKFAKYPLMIKRYCEDDRFRQWIGSYNRPDILIFERFGEKNPDKRLYYMRFDNEAWGFFAYWKFMIRGFAYAERYGLIPVVDWTKNSPYYDKEITSTDDPFEYYFEPVSDISVLEARESANVVCSRDDIDKVDIFQKDISYSLDNEIGHYVFFNKKYVRLRTDIQKKIYMEISSLLRDKRTLAMHVRGVEWGNIIGHPIPVGLEGYFALVDAAMMRYGFEQIFLATDSEETIERCIERYGDKLVFYTDVARSAVGEKTLMIFGPELKREKHHYRMGYEVLRDMLTISMCEGAIAGLSNVALAARVFKETRGEQYRYFETLRSQQVSKKGISPHKAVKRMKKKKAGSIG